MKLSSCFISALSIAFGSIALSIAPVSAHHSFALYDMSKSTEIIGTVQKFEWSNPHSWLFVAAPDASGTSVTYGFEMTSVGELLRRGWTKVAVKPGDKIKVSFHPVRDGSPAGLFQNAWTADGSVIGRLVINNTGGNVPSDNRR